MTITAEEVHQTVRTILRNQLKTASQFPGNNNVDWESKSFNSSLPQPWWRERLNPGMSHLTSLGPNARERHDGIYMVDVFVPSGKGGRNADVMAGSLFVAFPPNLSLMLDGLTVTIPRRYRSRALVGADWIQVPVTIEWFTYTINTI